MTTLLSCFSGVGGLDRGLEAAGFVTLGCLEIDRDARATLAENRPAWRLLEPSDVVEAGRALAPQDVGIAPRELTLLAGGPPCQPFSKAAQWAAPKRGIKDDRGTTVDGMMDLAASFLPRAILMENVAGFLSGKNNATARIKKRLREINSMAGTRYRLRSWVVDAADYGVPQHRARAIMIAFRDGEPAPSVLPRPHGEDHRTVWDALEDRVPDPVPSARGGYADLLTSIPEGSNYQHLTARGGGEEVELFGYRTRYWSFLLKLAKDRPAWTLPASPGPSTGPFHWSGRPLASSERMLLQGFPADWRLTENERVNVRLAGNATPPPLAEAMGKLILHLLEKPGEPMNAETIRASLATTRSTKPVPPPADPAPLPPRWKAVVGPQIPHPGKGAGPAGYHRASSSNSVIVTD